MALIPDPYAGAVPTTTGPSLSTLWSDWNTALGNAAASGKGSLKFTPAAADDAIRSCNTLLGYLAQAADQLSSLTIDAAQVMPAPVTVPNLTALISQYNTMAQEGLYKTLNAHQSIVTDMRDTFRVASGLIQKTDLTSASALSGSSTDPTTTETVGNQQPAILVLPTGNTKMATFDNPVAEFQSKNPYDSGLDYMPDDSTVTGYAGQFTSKPNTAGVSSAMDWSQLVALGKVNPQPIINVGTAWTQIARYLNGGFRSFGTDMSAAISNGSWTGHGHQAAESAVKAYRSSFPDLVSAINYMGTLMTYTANWLNTTRQFMPTLETEPWSPQYLGHAVSAGAGPAVTYSFSTPAEAVAFDGFAAYVPSQTFSTSLDSPPAAKAHTITALYQGGWVQADPTTVQSTLMNYYQQQYESWYEGPYALSSATVPALAVPKSPVSPTTASPAVAGISGVGGGGISVPVGGTSLPVTGVPSTGATVPVRDLVNTPATPTAGTTPTVGTTPTATVPTAATAATGATPASDLSSVASGLASTGQQAAQALSALPAAAQAGKSLSGVPGLPGLGQTAAARALTGLKAGGGGGSGVGAGGVADGLSGEESEPAVASEATASSRLFPRASLAGEAEDTMLGRAGAAEPMGSPGAPGSAGRGSGEQDKQRKRAEYLRSSKHVEDAIGDALLTTAPVVDSQ